MTEPSPKAPKAPEEGERDVPEIYTDAAFAVLNALASVHRAILRIAMGGEILNADHALVSALAVTALCLGVASGVWTLPAGPLRESLEARLQRILDQENARLRDEAPADDKGGS